MATRKVRVKKLSTKTPLPVLREDQIDPNEYESLTSEIQIATGVEQAEENEYHLQAIIKDAGTSQDAEIPVPPPIESENVNYDQLYPNVFQKTSTYIRFSSTVEESISCQYDMTAEDDDFLKQYNAKKTLPAQLSEDDFERIMEVYEDTAADQTPFAAVDNTVVGYDQMVPGLNHVASTAPKVMSHAKFVYEYWKSQRQGTGNKPLHPTLKFETHQESDDTDPYVCFRRREARQTRKTRARDVLSTEKLKKLRKELEDGRQLILMAYEREMLKRELMNIDRLIFEQRAKMKEMKVRLGIKGDDEDFINQKPQKRRPTDIPVVQRPPGLRLHVRPDGRPVEADLVSLAEKLAEKENELRSDIEQRAQNLRRWNANHIDLTRAPLSPLAEQSMELSFRPAKTQYLMTPPASTSSESMDIDEDASGSLATERGSLAPFQFRAGRSGEPVSTKQPSFRRRIGRLNRLWIDRRGLASPPGSDSEEYSDRWKYDQDDDDEPPVYEVDPFGPNALRFRATIPLALMGPRKQIAPELLAHSQAAQAAGVAGARPPLPQPPQQAQTAA